MAEYTDSVSSSDPIASDSDGEVHQQREIYSSRSNFRQHSARGEYSARGMAASASHESIQLRSTPSRQINLNQQITVSHLSHIPRPPSKSKSPREASRSQSKGSSYLDPDTVTTRDVQIEIASPNEKEKEADPPLVYRRSACCNLI